MNKNDALAILFESAKLYEQNLANKNLLVVYRDGTNAVSRIEVLFLKKHFLHLSGVKIDRDSISSTKFFSLCKNKRLRIQDFDFAPNGTTVQKLCVLQQLMSIYSNASMIGVFDGNRLHLQTKYLVGSVHACMGFIIDGETGYYIPNTALQADIRDLCREKPHRILAILSKNTKENKYSTVCKRAACFRLDELEADDVGCFDEK